MVFGLASNIEKVANIKRCLQAMKTIRYLKREKANVDGQ